MQVTWTSSGGLLYVPVVEEGDKKVVLQSREIDCLADTSVSEIIRQIREEQK